MDALLDRQLVPIAVVGEGDAFDVFHYEERLAPLGRAGLEHAGDVVVVHPCQRLALGFKTRNHLLRVHTWFDDLQGNSPPNGFCLIRHVDDAHPALADFLQQSKLPDGTSNCFVNRVFLSGSE